MSHVLYKKLKFIDKHSIHYKDINLRKKDRGDIRPWFFLLSIVNPYYY
jgi:hypothetical protein